MVGSRVRWRAGLRRALAAVRAAVARTGMAVEDLAAAATGGARRRWVRVATPPGALPVLHVRMTDRREGTEPVPIFLAGEEYDRAPEPPGLWDPPAPDAVWPGTMQPWLRRPPRRLEDLLRPPVAPRRPGAGRRPPSGIELLLG